MAATEIWGPGFDPARLTGSSCAFGVFDGVHEGHRYIIGRAIEGARECGGPSVAITFDRDPDEVFAPQRLKKLMTNEARLKALAKTGVDLLLVIPFTREFAAETPLVFMESLFGAGAPAQVHVGVDFRFGAKAAGTIGALMEWGKPRGLRAFGHELLAEGTAPVTATRIRGLLAEGNIGEANRLLTRPYALEGTVVEGRQEGREFGFRTANLEVPAQLLAIGAGVYAAWAEVDGVPYRAAVAVGVAPTFAEEATANVEVHLIDFDQDIYGQPITVRFVEWLRPMKKFASLEELKTTILANIAYVRNELSPLSS